MRKKRCMFRFVKTKEDNIAKNGSLFSNLIVVEGEENIVADSILIDIFGTINNNDNNNDEKYNNERIEERKYEDPILKRLKFFKE